MAISDFIAEQAYLISFITAIIALLLTIYIGIQKKRNTVKKMPAELQNSRILHFQPKPLVNEELVKKFGESAIEVMHPDENEKGTYHLGRINFLNFLNDPEMQNLAEHSIRTYGVGTCGPRGFYGTLDVHLLLEGKLAEFLNLEESVLYSYGFSTVASAIGAYCKKYDIIFSDEKISFAAKQGFLAARSTIEYFKHNDVKDLEEKLQEYENKEKINKKVLRKFLVVEGLYQKTGQICPLPELMELREKYKLRIFIDETLSFGVLGKHGRGITEHFNIDITDVDMIMGSLEGSICSVGGFCAGASVIIEHQRLSGLGYCFSASLPAFLSQVAVHAIELFEKRPSMFVELENVSKNFHNKLMGLDGVFEILSDPISPLKVIKPRDNYPDRVINPEDEEVDKVSNIRTYCAQRKLYLGRDDENILLYSNNKFSDDDLEEICRLLAEAFVNT